MTDGASRIDEHMIISKANSKFFQKKFTLLRGTRADANP